MITLEISKEIPTMIIITILIIAAIYYLGSKIKKANPYQELSLSSTISILIVDGFDKLVAKTMDEKAVKNFGPYIATIAFYILCSNLSGLFGLNAPTANLSNTLALAIITWVLIEFTSLKYNGLKSYIKSLFEPFFVFFIPNLLSKFAPLISMSIRLFGNILSGSTIMAMLYLATNMLSELILKFINLNFSFNFVALIITPILHLYFDIFSGFIQTMVFVYLTMILIQKEK